MTAEVDVTVGGSVGLDATLPQEDVQSARIEYVSLTHVALRELRAGRAPLLVHGPKVRARPSEVCGDVIVCLDGSARAEGVLPMAARHADSLGVGLTLLQVVPASGPVLRPQIDGNDVLEGSCLAALARSLRGARPLTWEVLHGRTADAVLDYARRIDASLIALNSHGDSARASAPWGAVARRLLLESPVPVLLTRITDDGRPPATPRRPPVAAGLVAAALLGLLATIPAPFATTAGATVRADRLLSGSTPVLMPVLETEDASSWEALRGWLDPGVSVDLDPERGASVTRARVDSRRLMAESVQVALGVATGHLGRDQSAVEVSIDTGGIRGPSGALALALAIVDVRSSADLTRGRLVAATGGLAPEGAVLPVGGVAQKARAAMRAGADVLLVPAANAYEARLAVPRLRVIPVATFSDAVDALTR